MSGRRVLSYSLSRLFSISVASSWYDLGTSIWLTVVSCWSSSSSPYSSRSELEGWWGQRVGWKERRRVSLIMLLWLPVNNHHCHENFVAAAKHRNQWYVRLVFELKPTVEDCQTPDSGFGHSCKWLLSSFFFFFGLVWLCDCVYVQGKP